MSAAAFLGALMDGTHPHSLCTAADRERRWLGSVGFYTDPEKLIDAGADLTRKGRAAWFGVNPLKEALTPPERGGDDDVVAVRVIAADIDWLDPAAHKDLDLLPEAEVRTRFATFQFKPTYVVETAHGLQAYWLLDSDVTPERGWALTSRMHDALEALGLKVERGDLASVLRLPGSFNWKTEPTEVRLVVD